VQELMAASDIVISERVDIEVRTEAALDLTLIEKPTVDLTLVESGDQEIDDESTGETGQIGQAGEPGQIGESGRPGESGQSGGTGDSGRPVGLGEIVGDQLPPELAWQERALCAQTDPEAFFPEKGGSTREAKRVCMSCEVRAECLDYALAKDERFGIWGGLSERERRRVKKQAV
jgi:WhiB family redox-sensing transcriptional regulator